MDAPFFRLADALDALPCMADPSSREIVIGQLPSAIAGAIHRHNQRRMEVMEILRACLDYRDGVRQLLAVAQGLEGDSLPLRRLSAVVAEVLPQLGG